MTLGSLDRSGGHGHSDGVSSRGRGRGGRCLHQLLHAAKAGTTFSDVIDAAESVKYDW